MSGTSSKKSLLTIQIIGEHFGKIAADVAKYIIRHENNSVTEIIRYFARQNQHSKSTVKASQVRESLLVLLQQNCLTLEPDTSADLVDGEASVFLYRVDRDMVINRLRFPKFLSIINSLYGELAVTLAEELIFHGRLRFAQVVEDVQEQQQKARAAALSEVCAVNDIDIGSIDESSLDAEIEQHLPAINTREEIENMFETLAENRFIIPAPSRSTYVASAETLRSEIIRKEKAAKTNKLMDGDGKGGGGMETFVKEKDDSSVSNGKVTIKRSRQAEGSVEDLASLPVEVRALMDAQRASESSGQAEDEADAPPVKASRTRGGGRGRGGRSGRGGRGRGSATQEIPRNVPEKNTSAVEDPPAPASMGPRKDVLWMVGWAQLAEEERNALCVSVTTQRMGTAGASVVKLLLGRGSRGDGSGGASSSGANPAALMSVADIHAGLRSEEGLAADAKSMDLKTLSMLLETMRCDSTGCVDKSLCEDKSDPSGRSAHYLVNKAAILSAVRRRLIHAIAEERFGYQSARIVELLQCKNYLEQQKISDMAILPAKEGRERLYDLYQHHWVDYMEVSKRGDFNPANTFYFWTLSREKLVESLLDAQYGTVYNLRCRYLKEMADGKSLLDFSDKITDSEEAEKFDKLSESFNRLDNAVLKIVENITVLGIL